MKRLAKLHRGMGMLPKRLILACSLCFVLGVTLNNLLHITTGLHSSSSSSSSSSSGPAARRLRLDPGSSRRGIGVVPRLIHRTTRNKTHLSCMDHAVLQEWRRINPEYQHVLADDADMRALIVGSYPDLLFIYDSLLKPVEKADLWRYMAVHAHGGVYVGRWVHSCSWAVCWWPACMWVWVGMHVMWVFVGMHVGTRAGRSLA